MFDNSCELFENEMQHKNIENEKRIKEIVFLEIGHTKAKRNRRRYIAVLAAAMGIGGITVGAHEVLKSAGEIKNNEEVVLENQNGLALYERKTAELYKWKWKRTSFYQKIYIRMEFLLQNILWN